MNSEEVLGAVGMASLTVRPADTSVAQALNDLPILATPTLLNIFETSPINSEILFIINDYL